MAPKDVPAKSKAVFIEEFGSSLDVLKYEDVETPQVSAPTDVIVKNRYAGVNFVEAYFRMGIYPCQTPYILGREAAGEVVAVGDSVKKYTVGDKVAYMSAGTFAEYTKIAEDKVNVLNLGKSASDETLKLYSAIIVQGLTALTFIYEAHLAKKNEYIVVWAAAGGVGRVLVQLLSQRGIHVIAIASTEEKLKLAKSLGAEFLINHNNDDIVAKVKEITGGKGVSAVFDSVGKETFQKSLDILAPKGTFVSFGNASGVVPPFSIALLSPKNLKLLRPSVFTYVAEESDWKKYTSELLGLIESGKLDIDISKTYPLKDYKIAAGELEGRKTTGKIVLSIPE